LHITNYIAHYLYELQAINTHTYMSQDEINTTVSCCIKTVNDVVSGWANGIFLYLLLIKTINSKFAQKSLYLFHIFCPGTIGEARSRSL